MKTFHFDIVVGGIKIRTDENLFDVSDALYEAGCDDSHPAAYNGTLYVPFTRKAESYEQAVTSAIQQIESIQGLICLSVDLGGMVSLSDIAELSGQKKATLSRYHKGTRGTGDFPNPILRVDSTRPLWQWSDVAGWLEKQNFVNQELVDNAKITDEFNAALSIRQAQSLESISKLVGTLNNNRAHIALN